MNLEESHPSHKTPSVATGPFAIAIADLEAARSMSYTGHDIAVQEGRYDDAKHLNERVKSLAKAIHLLAAADFIHTTK